MLQVSYTDLIEISAEHEGDQDIQVGDLVKTGPNLYPHYTVIAIHGEKVWLRDVQTLMDGLTNLSRCKRINGPV
jgi:hypothetical protein